MITGIDLFCGIGGLTHGLTQGGVRIVAGIDVDQECKFPFETNNSAEFLNRNIADVTSRDLRALWGRTKLTLLAGCAPCQSFSTYSRKGRSHRCDAKWELVSKFGELIRESRPMMVTMENVPQLLDHPVFSDFIRCLSGYHVWYQPVDCADFGVPQTRKRLVLLASRLGPVSLIQPPVATGRPTVRTAIASLPMIAAGESDPGDNMHTACRLSDINLRRIRASIPGGTWRDWPKRLVARCHRKSSGNTYPSVYGRMQWDSPAPTITTQCFGYGNGRFGHPEQDRAITLREAALLQTFPRSYQFLPLNEPVRFSVLGRLIGNAVPVRLGKAIAESFVSHINELEEKP